MKQIIITFFIFICFIINAQPPKKFQCIYGGNGYDVGNDIKQTLDKGYIITGSTSSFGQGNTDLYLLKLDSMGHKVFEKSFGGYSNDIGKSIVQLSDSSYVMAGYTSSIGIGGYDVFLVKADKNGNLIWQKTIGGSDWDFANSMDTTSDGGFIIAGSTYSYGHGNSDGYIIKTDGNGDTTWTRTYGGFRDDEFKSVIQTIDGNYALTGYSKSYNDSLGDIWCFKIGQNGDSLWCNFFGGNREDFGNEIVQNQQGDFFIAGARDSLSAGKLDAYALKINSMGIFIWDFLDGNISTNESYNSVTVSKIKTGFSVYAETEVFPGYGIHVKIFEMNSAGYYNNATEYGDVLADEILKITSTYDKGYVGVGYTNNYGAKLTDTYLIKLDTTLLGSISIVSVKEILKNNFNIYIFPNPSNNNVNIDLSSEIENTEIKLFDFTGKEIFISDKIYNTSIKSKTLNVEDLSNGIYYLKIFNRTEKISVIH